jgi:hypothetical protein
VPVVQPHGDWILFHSWNGHALRIGGADFGGLGSGIWVMKRDGTARYEPAEYDYELILSVFSQSFLQPVFQQATDVWEMMLRWNRARRRFEPRPVRRRTDSGANAWVIPSSHGTGGRRLLWTQNKSGDGYRIDQEPRRERAPQRDRRATEPASIRSCRSRSTSCRRSARRPPASCAIRRRTRTTAHVAPSGVRRRTLRRHASAASRE